MWAEGVALRVWLRLREDETVLNSYSARLTVSDGYETQQQSFEILAFIFGTFEKWQGNVTKFRMGIYDERSH